MAQANGKDQEPVYNAADEEIVRQRTQELKTERERDDEAIRLVLATPEGRRMVWMMLEEHHVFSKFSGTSSEMLWHFHGMREAGLSLMKRLQAAAPEEFKTILKERWE